MTRKHLFILCPPASGSSLLWKLLKTSPQVSAFPGEGLAMVKSRQLIRNRWNPREGVDWKAVKRKWRRIWDPGKSVLLEKSPSHLVRAGQLADNFENSHFIIMIRNPYAFSEGVKRRWSSPNHLLSRYSYFNIAKFWAICAGYQLQNQKCLQRNMLLTYEDLTEHRQETCRRLIDFVPELGTLNPEGEFPVFEKSGGIENMNDQQIARLGKGDFFQINEVLRRYPQFLHPFGYQLLNPAARPGFVAFRRMAMIMSSLNRLPSAVRWHNWESL